MSNTSAAGEPVIGYDVVDSSGAKIGTVDNVWVDNNTGNLEFIDVKSGMLGMTVYVVPAGQAQISGGNRVVQLPYTEDQIKNAPRLTAGNELSSDDEGRLYQYYGLSGAPTAAAGHAAGHAGAATGASTGASTGAATGAAAAGAVATGASAGVRDKATASHQETIAVPLHEEQLNVGKRAVEAGQVRLRKVVRTEHVSTPVELRHERVEVERVAATGGQVGQDAFQEKDISIPVMREEAVATKEAQVTGEVRLHKTAETHTQAVEGDVRKEDVVVDKGATTEDVERKDVRR